MKIDELNWIEMCLLTRELIEFGYCWWDWLIQAQRLGICHESDYFPLIVSFTNKIYPYFPHIPLSPRLGFLPGLVLVGQQDLIFIWLGLIWFGNTHSLPSSLLASFPLRTYPKGTGSDGSVSLETRARLSLRTWNRNQGGGRSSQVSRGRFCLQPSSSYQAEIRFGSYCFHFSTTRQKATLSTLNPADITCKNNAEV